MRLRVIWLLALCFGAWVWAAGGAGISVSIDPAVRGEPASGRLVVYLIRPDSQIKAEPTGGPFYGDPQPLYGMDVKELAAGEAAVIDDSATSYPVKLSELPAGKYRAQAVLRIHHDCTNWRWEPGNVYSDVQEIELGGDGDGPARISLKHAVEPRAIPKEAGVELFQIRSKLLSRFRGRDVFLRAGVVFPIKYDPERHYPAVYVVPGFSGDHLGAFVTAGARKKLAEDSVVYQLGGNAFWIVLDAGGPNGHTLFANSEVNGPRGDALVEEMLPALEGHYHLIRAPSARLIRGHSSGGWAALWLTMMYPQTFGACWAISADPVDFHRLERVDVYLQKNLYIDRDSTADHEIATPSMRYASKTYLTVRDENLMEEVLGPDNTSAQQWDSWQAVFGPRNPAGHPAALFDPLTGKIDHAVAQQYESHDITELVRREPGRFVPDFHQRVRLLVGGQDSFFLNEAVEFLRSTLQNVGVATPASERVGYIKIVPEADHGSILRTPEGLAISGEMLEHLRRHGHVPATNRSQGLP